MYDVTQARPVCHEAVCVGTAYTRDQLLLAESADEQCLRCGCSSPSCAVVPYAADIDGPRHTRLSCARARGDSGAYTPYCSRCWSRVCVCVGRWPRMHCFCVMCRRKCPIKSTLRRFANHDIRAKEQSKKALSSRKEREREGRKGG